MGGAAGREGGVPGSIVNYRPLLVCGMILVVVAALLLPVRSKPRSSEAPNGGAEDGEEEEAESGF